MKYLNFKATRTKLGGRSRSAIYLDVEAGRLPQPLKLGGRLYWVEDEIDAHLSELRTDTNSQALDGHSDAQYKRWKPAEPEPWEAAKKGGDT